MRSSIKFLSVIFLLTFLGFSANAQKFGYINTQALVQDIPQVKEANANIETYRNQLQKRSEEMIKALQKKYQDLQLKQERGEIAPKELETEAALLTQEEQKINEFNQNSQQKIIDKSQTLLKPLMDRVQNAIDEVAKEMGYDYIFDASLGVLLYADPSTDVSEAVKAKLGL